MGKKIGVISPSPEFTTLVESASTQLGITVTVKEGALTSGLYYANQLIRDHQINTIVARGSTANLLKARLDIPVVKINITDFDLLKAFQKARKQSKEIVFIDHEAHENDYDLDYIANLLSIRIILKQYRDEKDITHHIKRLSLDKETDIIVGTAQCLANRAINRGIPSVVVRSSLEAVVEALKRADEISSVYEEEKLRQHHLETIISSAFDGVIATDQDGKITVFNEMASKVLNIQREAVIGKYLDAIQYPLVKRLYGDGSRAEEKIVSMAHNQYVVNRIPIEKQGNSLVITFQEIDKVMQLNTTLRSELYHRRFYAKYVFDDIVRKSIPMKSVIETARKYSKTESNILITGESGTGKELMAQSIHNESQRREGPFIAINCAALPKSLLESELFGYEEGAFTGAKKGGKPGLFEMAHGGTVFLDEIGELPIDLQARLLRVLQEKEVMRIGGERIIPIDVRVISATNKDLLQGMKEGDFRVDLYYRLNILHIGIPPLRDRKSDIPALVRQFLRKHHHQDDILDQEMLDALISYDWPGNVRELENVVERLVALGGATPSELRHMLFQGQPAEEEPSSPKDTITVRVSTLREMEQEIIHQLYDRAGDNKQDLAKTLGISRTTLWKRVKEIDGSG